MCADRGVVGGFGGPDPYGLRTHVSVLLVVGFGPVRTGVITPRHQGLFIEVSQLTE